MKLQQRISLQWNDLQITADVAPNGDVGDPSISNGTADAGWEVQDLHIQSPSGKKMSMYLNEIAIEEILENISREIQ